MSKPKPLSSKVELLALRSKYFVDVEIDGTPLRLARLSGADRARIATMTSAEGVNLQDVEFTVGLQVEIVAKSLVDENGSRIFSAEDRDEILSLPATVLDGITEEALKLNKMNPGAVQESVEDFEPAQSDTSGSA